MGSQDFQAEFCKQFSFLLLCHRSILWVRKYRRHFLRQHLSTQETLGNPGYLVSWLASIKHVYLFVGLLFGWYICQLSGLLFGKLFVSWLGVFL
jgi:hypothetical protein